MPPREDFRNRSAKARERLGVSAEQITAESRITPLLKKAGVKIDRALEILEADDSDDAKRFVTLYRSIPPSDVKHLSIEEIALAAKVTPRRLWEVLCGAALQQGRETVQFMVAVNQPAIVAASIRSAKTTKGVYDREHLYKATGLLPTPKGSTTIISVGGKTEAEPPPTPHDPDETTSKLPGADDYFLEIQKAIAPARQLPPVSSVMPENAPAIEELPAGELL